MCDSLLRWVDELVPNMPVMVSSDGRGVLMKDHSDMQLGASACPRRVRGAGAIAACALIQAGVTYTPGAPAFHLMRLRD